MNVFDIWLRGWFQHSNPQRTLYVCGDIECVWSVKNKTTRGDYSWFIQTLMCWSAGINLDKKSHPNTCHKNSLNFTLLQHAWIATVFAILRIILVHTTRGVFRMSESVFSLILFTGIHILQVPPVSSRALRWELPTLINIACITCKYVCLNTL